MIELVMAVCMIDQPSRCKDVTINFAAENLTVNRCLMSGQLEMAKWIGEHPNWVIRKYTCRQAGEVAKL